MTGYTKLFGSIVASTIWREDDKTRIVWITMLAIANRWGVVEASVPGLADLARVTVKECQAALVKLEAEDEFSRTKDFDGRRIEEVPGGWHILNHAKYRAKMGADERREYLRLKQREHRARVNTASTEVNNVNDSQHGSTLSTHAEADTEAKAKEPPKAPRQKRRSQVDDSPKDPRHYQITSRIGEVYRKVIGEEFAMKNFSRFGIVLSDFLSTWKGTADDWLQRYQDVLKASQAGYCKKEIGSATNPIALCQTWPEVAALIKGFKNGGQPELRFGSLATPTENMKPTTGIIK